jgi:hypothetical protein
MTKDSEIDYKETVREYVKRVSRQAGLHNECLDIFDREVLKGTSEEEASYIALYEWDI